MNKRPKSREETPKEGSDSARRYRTATICDRAAQKASVFEAFPVQKPTASAGLTIKSQPVVFIRYFNWLTSQKNSCRSPCPPALEFVINGVIGKLTAVPRDSKAGQWRKRTPYKCACAEPCAAGRIGLGNNQENPARTFPPPCLQGTAVTVIDFTAFIGRLATASAETILAVLSDVALPSTIKA